MLRDINPAWSFGQAIGNNHLKMKCNLRGKVTNGGITRFKQHLAHIAGIVAGCTKVSRDVREQIRALLNQNKARKVEIKEKRHGSKMLMLPVMRFLGMKVLMRKMHRWRLHAESPS